MHEPETLCVQRNEYQLSAVGACFGPAGTSFNKNKAELWKLVKFKKYICIFFIALYYFVTVSRYFRLNVGYPVAENLPSLKEM